MREPLVALLDHLAPIPISVRDADQLAETGQVRLRNYFASAPGLMVTPDIVVETSPVEYDSRLAVASPQTLTNSERERAVLELWGSRQAFLNAVQGLSPAQRNIRPSPVDCRACGTYCVERKLLLWSDC
jgi:hypothetical protein